MTEAGDPKAATDSLVDEAVRLLAALRESQSSSGDHPPSCTWCPVCRGVEAVRAVDPAAVDRLTVAITLLAQALSELGAHLRERVVPPGYAPETPAHPQTSASRSGQTFDIPVTDEDPE
ncbi:MAG: hypothetical protein V9G19_04880 [Tetrasphaera sp.]